MAPSALQLDSEQLLADCAFALASEFAELRASDLIITEDVDDEFVRADWDSGIAIFPRSDEAAERLAIEASLLPHLRGFLSPAVSIWSISSGPIGPWRWGWRATDGERRIEGRPLLPELIVDQNRERLVREIARFLHELHGFSVERARALGVAPARAWRERQRQLSRRSLSLLRPLLGLTEIGRARRWWARYLDDDGLWRYQPALVHGGLVAERLLVDPLVRELIAVEGWQRARVADPALDIAALVQAYGTDLSWRVMAEYGELGSQADAAVFRRVRMLLTARRFEDMVNAVDRDGAESEAAVRALAALRSGLALNG